MVRERFPFLRVWVALAAKTVDLLATPDRIPARTLGRSVSKVDCMANTDAQEGEGRRTTFVYGQLGQTLDGRIACLNGASRYINGSAALDHLHALRAQVDAVIVGVGTVIADDPQLTVRRCEGASPRPVVIDPRRRTPDTARLRDTCGLPPLFIRCEGDVRTDDEIGVPSLDASGGGLDPVSIVEALSQRGYRRLLVEGGAATLSRFIDNRAVDSLHILMAPIILGSGVTGLNLLPVDSLEGALRPDIRLTRFDDGDILYECALSTPWNGR